MDGGKGEERGVSGWEGGDGLIRHSCVDVYVWNGCEVFVKGLAPTGARGELRDFFPHLGKFLRICIADKSVSCVLRRLACES